LVEYEFNIEVILIIIIVEALDLALKIILRQELFTIEQDKFEPFKYWQVYPPNIYIYFGKYIYNKELLFIELG
jgi:hypothetical protein